ncbi:MAG TPA: type II toxin-antitoxin system VapB family antitoxin [Ilumatobacteraceae bacterium]|nr:type II toxin-antitoxin system VapB family antitoxin [Ilumatobacteraceae bacterium]
MALNKDEETDRLARELAAATGESSLQEIIRRGRARATLDPRTAEEVIGYDSAGLPA